MSILENLQRGELDQRREQRVHGLVMAKITGRMPDGTFELGYLGMGKNAPSAPARMMMPMAGGKRGTYFMPEVGDEVVVGFETGDTNVPIILGGVWNGPSPPPAQAKATDMGNNVKTIVSRSGHEVTLDDTAAAGGIKLKTNGGHELTMDDTPPGKITLKSKGGISIVFDDATGTLTFTAPSQIILAAPGVALAAGGISMSPTPANPAQPPPPGQMSINAPLALNIQSTAIALNAATIALTTTGVVPASLVSIEGQPYGMHVHTTPPTPPPPPIMTGPVSPVP